LVHKKRQQTKTTERNHLKQQTAIVLKYAKKKKRGKPKTAQDLKEL